jgi:hypothetical protein
LRKTTTIIIPILIVVSLLIAYYYKTNQGKTQYSSIPNTITSNQDKTQSNNKETTSDNKNVQEEDYKNVFGDVKIETIRAELSDGRPWGELAISNKGEIFGFAPANNNIACQLLTYNLNAHKTEVIYSIKDNLQPVIFKYNDDYFAWTESLSQYDSRQSRIILYNRKNKESVVLSEEKNIPPEIPPQNISLGKDYLLWSKAELDKDTVKYSIMKYDITSKKTSVFKKDATVPSIGKNYVAWIGPENEKRENSAIYLNNLKDNTTRKITKGKNPFYLDSDGYSFAFSGTDNLNYQSKVKEESVALYSLNLYENEKVKIIKKSESDHFEFPQISNNYISWRGTDKVRVYDRKTNKIAILPSKYPGYGEVLISNNYILWHSPAIKDEDAAKKKAIDQGIYLSDIHIIHINNEK